MIPKRILNDDLRKEKIMCKTEYEMGPKQKIVKPISKLAVSTNAKCARNSLKVIYEAVRQLYIQTNTYLYYLLRSDLMDVREIIRRSILQEVDRLISTDLSLQ